LLWFLLLYFLGNTENTDFSQNYTDFSLLLKIIFEKFLVILDNFCLFVFTDAKILFKNYTRK